MNDLIVTIGRENGSGGREVGQILAEKLGIPCYDQQILDETATKAGIPVEEVKRREETASSKLFFGGMPAANPLYNIQSDTINSLASSGPCIFVGRCADVVLASRKNLVKVFVVAPVVDRMRRSAARNGISEKEAYERIRTKDSERAAYYQRYTGKVWGSVSNYDLTVNTGPIGVENAADMIIEYIRMAGIELPEN